MSVEFLASASVIFFLDQWSKKIVDLHVGDRPIAWRLLRIKRARNARKIFGRAGSRAVLVLLWFAALISAIILHRAGGGFHGRAALVGLGVAFGGAGGNLLDILRRRCIIDFIDLGWWPVFNVADAAIVGGLILAFWPQR